MLLVLTVCRIELTELNAGQSGHRDTRAYLLRTCVILGELRFTRERYAGADEDACMDVILAAYLMNTARHSKHRICDRTLEQFVDSHSTCDPLCLLLVDEIVLIELACDGQDGICGILIEAYTETDEVVLVRALDGGNVIKLYLGGIVDVYVCNKCVGLHPRLG